MKGKKKGLSFNDETVENVPEINLEAHTNTESEEKERVEVNGEGEKQPKEDAAVDELDKPKLAEGFFEIEAIRQRRVRKGQLQYLIKWRGWPETSNTWEPLKNLVACSDVVDAFEESLNSGKPLRKRKRKHGSSQREQKKKQPPSSSSHVLHALKTPPAVNGLLGGHDLPTNSSKYEHDPKLSELRRLTTNDGDADEKVADLARGAAKSAGEEPVRRLGSRRRKSFPVRRFQKDPAMENTTAMPTTSLSGSKSLYQSGEESKAGEMITKIVRPISFSASVADDSQDVLVNFVATRADGKDAIVDNRFMKANYPHLLIEFYEQHLKYTS